jgi:hypothetical protein
MATSREKRIKSMQESMDRLQNEYGDKKPAKKKKSKAKVKKASSKPDAPFSVFGLAGKIKKRKALNRASAKD